MKKPAWFIHNRNMGKHPKGPMPYQPNSWQGWLILGLHLILTLVLIYGLTRLSNPLFLILGILLGGGLVYGSYLTIASFFSKKQK